MRTRNWINGRRGIAVSLAGAVIAVSMGIPAAATALNDPSQTASAAASRRGPIADPGFPTFVHLPADQARRESQLNGSVSHSVVTERAAIRGGCGAEAG
jgi:hypothetical protein